MLVYGARSLVKTAAANTQRKTAALRKQADGEMLNNILQGGRDLLGKVDLKNPLHTGAIGAGIGGLGGLANSAFSGGDPEKKSKLRAMLLGGLAGGGIGAGAGAVNANGLPATMEALQGAYGTAKDKLQGAYNSARNAFSPAPAETAGAGQDQVPPGPVNTQTGTFGNTPLA